MVKKSLRLDLPHQINAYTLIDHVCKILALYLYWKTNPSKIDKLTLPYTTNYSLALIHQIWSGGMVWEVCNYAFTNIFIAPIRIV